MWRKTRPKPAIISTDLTVSLEGESEEIKLVLDCHVTDIHEKSSVTVGKFITLDEEGIEKLKDFMNLLEGWRSTDDE